MMAGGFPILGGLANPQSLGGGTIQAAGSGSISANNTKGTYVQIAASTPADAVAIDVVFFVGFQSRLNAAFDIAVGASGSEVVIVPDILVALDLETLALALVTPHMILPVMIPKGSRVAVRAQVNNNFSSANTFISVQSIDTYDGSFLESQPPGAIDVVGFNAAATTGTAVTGGGTANTKGSYSQLVAATAADYVGFFLALDYQSTTANVSFNIDIAIGASGSEVVIKPNHYQQFDWASSVRAMPSLTSIYYLPIPAGSRVSARCSCTTASVVCGVTLYGVRA